ncbi:MAG: hypothetical protein FWB96_12630, partial [Defluviitaleaceae bacterium]|nr:hypothetical protein [Defluviitaleaceae bacterium]MCL2263971.1 hypothetical protein [Defluviitaleaceae bacterium]
HAASKIAGLKELPCAIYDNLTMTEQVGMMLEENYQRKTLTMAEEAAGMQLMLDLGEDVSGIAEKTGISKRSVSRRIKIVKVLGADTVAAVEQMAGQPISLDDYEKLCDIEDPNLRAELTDKLGTADFDRAHTVAKNKQVTLSSKKQILSAVEKISQKIENPDEIENLTPAEKLYRFDSQDLQTVNETAKAAKEIGAEIYHLEDSDGAIHVYVSGGAMAAEVKKDNEYDIAARLEQKAREERAFKLEKAFQEAYEIRISNVKSLKPTPAQMEIIERMELSLLLLPTHFSSSAPKDYVIRNLFDIRGAFVKDGETAQDALARLIDEPGCSRNALKLRTVYSCIEPGASDNISRLETAYDFLESLGFIPSEGECQLLAGTHPLFAKPTSETEPKAGAA